MSKSLHKFTTQVPNFILDKLMFFLEDAELRTVLFLVRQTYGFQKAGQLVGYAAKQIAYGIRNHGKTVANGTGLRPETVCKVAKKLAAMGLVEVIQGQFEKKQCNLYRLKYGQEDFDLDKVADYLENRKARKEARPARKMNPKSLVNLKHSHIPIVDLESKVSLISDQRRSDLSLISNQSQETKFTDTKETKEKNMILETINEDKKNVFYKGIPLEEVPQSLGTNCEVSSETPPIDQPDSPVNLADETDPQTQTDFTGVYCPAAASQSDPVHRSPRPAPFDPRSCYGPLKEGLKESALTLFSEDYKQVIKTYTKDIVEDEDIKRDLVEISGKRYLTKIQNRAFKRENGFERECIEVFIESKMRGVLVAIRGDPGPSKRILDLYGYLSEKLKEENQVKEKVIIY